MSLKSSFGRSRIAAAATVAALTIGVTVAAASPSFADGRRPASCSTAQLCFYVNAKFADGPGKLTSSVTNLAAYKHKSCGAKSSYTWTNCITSLWNATTSCWHLYDATGYAGSYHNLSGNDGYTDLTKNTRFNDKISSMKRMPTGQC